MNTQDDEKKKVIAETVYRWILVVCVLFFGPMFVPKVAVTSTKISRLDKKKIAEVNRISKSIRKLARVDSLKTNQIAESIYKASAEYNVDPKIMVAIIMQESTFRQNAVSSSGDLSISQINYEVWNKEFLRTRRAPLDLHKLKTDREYAIKRMAEILSILASRHKNDKAWFATYHSTSRVNKGLYQKKIAFHLDKIKSID